MILDPNNLLNELNDFVKPVVMNFLTEANEVVDNVIITGVYYPYLKSLILHKQDPRNPEFNFHEFGIALDINIQIGKRIYHKDDIIDDWIKTGVPDIAKTFNIRWGGLFNGYSDCVHFDAANLLLIKYKLNDVYQLIDKLKQIAYEQFGQDLTNAQLNKIVFS